MIRWAGCSGGHIVFIDHLNGWETSYYHITNEQFADGQAVHRGDWLGNTGQAVPCRGKAQGNHVHFTLWHFSGAYNFNRAAASLVGVNIGGRNITYSASPPSSCFHRISDAQTACVTPGSSASLYNDGSIGSGSGSGSVTPPVPISGLPFGSFDTASPARNSIHVRGWAIDPDTNNPIDVHVYVDSTGYPTTANVSRPDIDAVYHQGANHGFDFLVPVGPGTHNVCAYGINVGGGTNPQLGCKTFTTPAPIVGDLNADWLVNCTDQSILLDAFGTIYTSPASLKYPHPEDINHDQKVDIKDLSILLSHWTGPNDGTC